MTDLGNYFLLTHVFFYGWLLHMPVIQLFTICRGAKLWCADGGFSLLPEAELCSCPVFPSVWVAGHWSITLCLAVGVAKSATTGSASLRRMFGALKVPKQYVSSACEWTLEKWEKLNFWKVCLLKQATVEISPWWCHRGHWHLNWY